MNPILSFLQLQAYLFLLSHRNSRQSKYSSFNRHNVHCGKAMIRSNMWTPENWASVEGLPTYGQALVDHGNLSRSYEEMQAGVISNEENSLY